MDCLLLEEKMEVQQMLIELEKTGLICDGNELDEVYSSINLMLENNKFQEYGKAAKENSAKFIEK